MSMAGNKRQAQQDIAGFPLLSFFELKDCLLALGISVTAEDISKPSPQTTMMIYGQLVDILMGIPQESLEGPRSSLLGMMEHRELYADALQFTMFFRHCRTLTQACGVKTFIMMDLVKPDAGRLRSILSGIMNFAKWRDTQSRVQGNLLDRVHEQNERMERLRREVAAVEDEIQDIREKAEADKPKIEEASAANDVIRDDMQKLQAYTGTLNTANDELKRERSLVQERTASNTQAISQLQLKISSTRGRLVQSPDRIKRTISEMSTNLSHEKTTLSEHQRKTRELQNRLDIITNLERDLRDLIELSRAIHDRKVKLSEAERAKSGTIGNLEGKRIESESLEASLAAQDRQIQNAQSKAARQLAATAEMRATSMAKIETLKDVYTAKQKELSLIGKKKGRLDAEIRALDSEMEEFISQHETELNTLLQEYSVLRDQTDEYVSTLADRLGLEGLD